MEGGNIRIRRKNCQAGIVTALTATEPFLWSCRDGEGASPVGRPLLSMRTRCITVAERCRGGGGEDEEDPVSAALVVCGMVARLGEAESPERSGFGVVDPDVASSSSDTKRMVGFGETGDSVNTGLSSGTKEVIGERGGSVLVGFVSMLSLSTSTWAFKYSSRQSSNLTPLPSGSGGTARLSRRSYITL